MVKCLIGLVSVLIILAIGIFYLSSNADFINEDFLELPEIPKVTELKAVYVTSNTALSPAMDNIINLVKETELNSLIIDFDLREKKLIRRLRFADIFPVARILAFQHDGRALAHPELAIKTVNGSLWKDSGGRFWLDPASEEAQKITLEEARQAAKMGFGEINLDYIRFPSDGKLENTIYPFWDKKVSRAEVITKFSHYIVQNLKKEFPDLKVTVDLFGYTLLRDNDLGIGQSITELSQIFDYIYPMTYPSHYDSGNFNFTNPGAHPYEVVFQSLESGKKIFAKHQAPFENIRPWIQDFHMGAFYTPEMVRLQMKAATDAGLSKGWAVWNPNNKYRKEIFLSEGDPQRPDGNR